MLETIEGTYQAGRVELRERPVNERARRVLVAFLPDEWRARGHDGHSMIADPLFHDPARGDFRLKPESPALELGVGPSAVRPPDEGREGGR